MGTISEKGYPYNSGLALEACEQTTQYIHWNIRPSIQVRRYKCARSVSSDLGKDLQSAGDVCDGWSVVTTHGLNIGVSTHRSAREE